MDNNNKERDPLWAVAQERVKFKFHLYTYSWVTAFLGLIVLSNNL